MPTETPPPFVPFAPNFQPPNTAAQLPPTGAEVEGPPELRKETKKQKLAREKHEAAAAKKAAAEQASRLATPPPKPPRKRRTVAAKPVKRSPKYDLQTILKIAGTLKEADQPVFEKLLGELTALAKGSRERVLKALGEVFW